MVQLVTYRTFLKTNLSKNYIIDPEINLLVIRPDVLMHLLMMTGL